MTKMIIVVVLVLVQSVLGTQAQNVGQCIDNLIKSTKAGGNVCPAEEEYIRCYFVAMNVQSLSLSETDLTKLENVLVKSLTSYGIDCNIDMRAILRKVKEDKSNAVTRTTKKPTGYDGAVTGGDCLNTFNQAVRPNCLLLTHYLKCLIRVTGIYMRNPYSPAYKDEFSSLETKTKANYRSLGLNCNFDLKKLSAEVANEENYRNSESGLHTSVHGMMSLYTVTLWMCSYLFL